MRQEVVALVLQRWPGERLCVPAGIFQSGMVTVGSHRTEERRLACGQVAGSLAKVLRIVHLACFLPLLQQRLQNRILEF